MVFGFHIRVVPELVMGEDGRQPNCFLMGGGGLVGSGRVCSIEAFGSL